MNSTLFQKIEEEETLAILYEVSILPIPKVEKDIIKKEHNRLTYLLHHDKPDAKIPSGAFANAATYKTTIHHDQMVFIPGR